MTTTAPEVFAGFRDVGDEINRARLDVLAGRPIELAGILERIDSLCTTAQALPKPTQHALAPAAERALKACDQLQTELRAALAPRPIARDILP
jgi:hypothetical protein